MSDSPEATDREATPQTQGLGFGTAPVFLASICTILGAIMFLRFGYAVGNLGLGGALAVVVVGHLVTIPTALAIAEIATNRRVEGGGEYYIISRSFGVTIGAAIGLSLYLSQAVSVAFYMIAFGESFAFLQPWFEATTGLPYDLRVVSLPATLLLLGLVLTRGADLGVKALYVVASVLAVALILFFLGDPIPLQEGQSMRPFGSAEDSDSFFVVFAIVFPAFTGMTAGVGLSGDLANPRKSIPLGTITATAVGALIYVAMMWKLAFSAPPEVLATDMLVMQRIALWGPIIPIGLACATISSAIGSVLVAPRTLQALARDDALPAAGAVNAWLSRGRGPAAEPVNATLVTGALATGVVFLGDVNLVARVVSMFFMVTYGALCAISFLEHFAANPSYRPSFRSKWYFSLFGAVMCFLMMLQMDPVVAVVALLSMVGLYRYLKFRRGDDGDDLADIFSGVLGQATRFAHLRLQHLGRQSERNWRPSIIMVSDQTFERRAPVALLEWLCQRHGFGTYLHLVQGLLDAENHQKSMALRERLLADGHARDSSLFLDTIISPSMRSALAQSLQVPGISGLPNNTVLSAFASDDPDAVVDACLDALALAAARDMNGLVLRHTDRFFGNRRSIHIWLTWHDYENANLMVLMAYILLGHRDWSGAEIKIFAAVPHDRLASEAEKLESLVVAGRLPISLKNLEIIGTHSSGTFHELVLDRSRACDLLVLGVTQPRLRTRGRELLRGHDGVGDVLFVSASQRILID
jgi:solute carrier family 12 (sodium/potassium/chloride transporter), member 2